jgi:hypothetical protein
MPNRGFCGIYLEKDGKTYKSPMKGPKQALVFGSVIAPAHIVIEATRLPVNLICGIRKISTPTSIPILSKQRIDESIYFEDV